MKNNVLWTCSCNNDIQSHLLPDFRGMEVLRNSFNCNLTITIRDLGEHITPISVVLQDDHLSRSLVLINPILLYVYLTDRFINNSTHRSSTTHVDSGILFEELLRILAIMP